MTNNLFKYAVVFDTLLFTSCGDWGVRFESPQPEWRFNEDQIPDRLLGQYINLEDSVKLSITKDVIVRYPYEYFAALLDSVKIQVTNDTTYTVIEDDISWNVRVEGDSVFGHYIFADTIFNIPRGDLLRKFRGHYFLNVEMREDSWAVSILTRVRNGVVLASVSSDEDIAKLREITDTVADSSYKFRPTKKQLKKFIKSNGFSDKDVYVKLN